MAYERDAELTGQLPASRSPRRHVRPLTSPPPSTPTSLILARSFLLPCGPASLLGDMAVPPQATGLVVLAHSTCSCRRSARSQHIVRLLQQAYLGTFSVDLLTLPEQQRAHLRPPAPELLTQRLAQTVAWLQHQPVLLGSRLGLLGEGATASALVAVCPQLGNLVGAVVTLGSYSVASAPARVVPTLLVVGSEDAPGREACCQVQQLLGDTSQVCTIAGATASFQEPGTLANAVHQTTKWFTCHLSKPQPY